MKNLTRFRLILPCFPLLLICNRVDATLFYNFEEQGTGTVLATLHLASLPGGHAEVIELTFTTAGQAALGYGSTYLGSFDSSGPDFVSDGFGGLQSSNSPLTDAGIVDSDPPPSSILSSPTAFALTAGTVGSPVDSIELVQISEPTITLHGDWRAVPEPTSITLALTVVFCLAGRRRNL